MSKSAKAGESVDRRVLQAAREEVKGDWVIDLKDVLERSDNDGWEVVLSQLWVHRFQVRKRRGPQNFDDLNKLVNRRLAWEERAADYHLGYDAGH